MKINIKRRTNIKTQRGASLLITIVVMLALTVVALAATNSNSNQAFMVRNAQFRLETFNASYTEIEAQIASINTRKITQGIPDYIVSLIDGGIGSWVNEAGTGSLSGVAVNMEMQANSAYMEQTLQQHFQGICAVFGQQIGSGSEKIQCNELRILADSNLKNRDTVESVQNQVYEYRTLAE